MFLHIGADYAIPVSDIIAILSPDAGDNDFFLEKAGQTKKVVDIAKSETGSLIIANDAIYKSPISPQTLRNRITESEWRH